MGNEMERYREEKGTDGASLASVEDKAHRLASNINRLREQSDGGEVDQRAAVDRAEATS